MREGLELGSKMGLLQLCAEFSPFGTEELVVCRLSLCQRHREVKSFEVLLDLVKRERLNRVFRGDGGKFAIFASAIG